MRKCLVCYKGYYSSSTLQNTLTRGTIHKKQEYSNETYTILYAPLTLNRALSNMKVENNNQSSH